MDENDFATQDYLVSVDQKNHETNLNNFELQNAASESSYEQQQTNIDYNQPLQEILKEPEENLFKLDQHEISSLEENSRHASLEFVENLDHDLIDSLTNFNKTVNAETSNQNLLNQTSVPSNNLIYNEFETKNGFLFSEPELSANQYVQPEISEQIFNDETESLPIQTLNYKSDRDDVSNKSILSNSELIDFNNQIYNNVSNEPEFSSPTTVPSLSLLDNDLEEEDKFDEGKYSPSSESGNFLLYCSYN